MANKPEISGVLVHIAGDFNPSIFHPTWVLQNQIENSDGLSEDNINVIVCHKTVAEFSISGVHYLINQDRFQIDSMTEFDFSILNRVKKIAELLPHTPSRSIMFSKYMHINLRKKSVRRDIFEKLAPTDQWGEFGKEMQNGGLDGVSGLNSLRMTAKEEITNGSLFKTTRIEPSISIEKNVGLYIDVSFTYFLDSGDQTIIEYTKLIDGEYQVRSVEVERICNTVLEKI